MYPNVTHYCNVTYKNVHFTLRYTIVDISSKYTQTACIVYTTPCIDFKHPPSSFNFYQWMVVEVQDAVNFVLLQTIKIDRPINFVRCRAGQNWPFPAADCQNWKSSVNFVRCRDRQNWLGFVSPQPFIRKNLNFRSTLWTV